MREFIRSLAVLLAMAAIATAAEDAPELLSGPYSIHPGMTTMTVCWQTRKTSYGAVKYRQKGTADWRDAAEARGRFHTVTLAGLDAGREYEVRALAGGKDLAGLSFHTFPGKAGEFTFFVYGDTRSHPLDHQMVAAALAAEARRLGQPTFVVMLGDMAGLGSKRELDETVTAAQFFLPARPLLRMMPLVPLRGNHEMGTDLFDRYFPAPPEAGRDKRRERVLDYGPVRIVTVDQYDSTGRAKDRLKWLGDRLAEAGDRWRFVAFHEPLYSSGNHGGSQYWREMLEPVLIRGRVHAVFAGHDHDYERIKPQGGVAYFTLGGGGAPLEPQAELDAAYSARFEATLHFATVTVTPGKVTLKALRPTGAGDNSEVFDEVEIPRNGKWGGPAKAVL